MDIFKSPDPSKMYSKKKSYNLFTKQKTTKLSFIKVNRYAPKLINKNITNTELRKIVLELIIIQSHQNSSNCSCQTKKSI